MIRDSGVLPATRRPRVLACGCWDEGPGYPRAQTVLAAFVALGFDVVECRLPPRIGGGDKRRLVSAPWKWPGFALRTRRDRCALRRAVTRAVAEQPAVVFVPYPAHLATPWIATAVRCPIVSDLFLSVYDTVVEDRRLVGRRSPAAGVLRWLDRRVCRSSDLTLVDTPQQARYLEDLVGAGHGAVSWLPVSDPNGGLEPFGWPPQADRGGLEVLFFGTPVPLHGLRHLMVGVTRVDGVRLTVIGGSDGDRAWARRHGGRRICVGPRFVSQPALARAIAAAHLVAGVFGAGPKTSRVVPFKVAHALAAGRPVVTARTPAIEDVIGGRACLLCAPGDPDAIAVALRTARDTPELLAQLAGEARATYDASLSACALAERLRRQLAGLGVAAPEVPVRTDPPVRMAGVR